MKTTKLVALLIFGTLLLSSCRDNVKEEKVIHEVKEVKVEKDTVQREGVLERTAKEVDKEVNKEINKTIDDIGDDN